jgi:large subunit ribosomal protein L28
MVIPPPIGWGLFCLAGSFCIRVRKASGAFRRVEEVSIMAAVCEVCGKGPSWGMSVSHSHVRTKRRWSPNIQRVRAIVKGAPRRVYACTACIKSGKVVKAGR